MQPPRKRRRTIPRSPFAPWSNAQIQAEADRRLAAIYDPQRTQLQSQSTADVEAMKQAGLAAAHILREDAAGTGAAYDQAAQTQGNLASGFTSDMAAKIRAAQAAAAEFAKSQGAPEATQTLGADAAKNALYAVGGFNPASGLAAQGASARAWAEAQPGIEARQMEQNVRQRLSAGEQELLDLAAKRPELRQQILDELNKYELDKAGARIQQRQIAVQERAQRLYESQFGETVRSHKASERIDQLTAGERARHNRESEAAKLQANAIAAQRAELSAADLALRQSKQTADLAYRRRQGKKPNAELSREYGYIVDANGDPILDRRGHRIKVKTSSKKAAAGGFPTR